MQRKLTQPVLRFAFAMSLPLAASWAMAQEFSYDAESPSAAAIDDEATSETTDDTASSDMSDEPGALPEAAQEPTLAPVGANGDADLAESDDSQLSKDSVETEVIRERYPSTAIKIERHVAQDEDGNYFNHGLYTHFDDKGRVMGTGEYRWGKRQGKWQRWFATNEGPMFAGPMYKEFQGPFTAEANFKDDQLSGMWRIFDSKGRKASEWEFAENKPSGKSVWYFPSGKVRREIAYKAGEINGEVIEWSIDGKVVDRQKYIEGRRLAIQTDWYAPSQKRAEGWTLFARDIAKPNYNFWDGITTITVTGKDGVNQRHGAWTWWHKNSQKQMEGRYTEDAPVGKFTWWYANGQKQLEGEYTEGKQEGKFTWWHENGQKQMEGIYETGAQVGKWVRWNTDGKRIEEGDFGEDGKKIPVNIDTDGPDGDTMQAPTLQPLAPGQNNAGSRFKR
jgi:uncharacterized protein